MPITEKQKAALADLKRSLKFTDDGWNAKFADLPEDQLAGIADGVMGRSALDRTYAKQQNDIKEKEAELAKKELELQTRYTQEIARYGEFQAGNTQQLAQAQAEAARWKAGLEKAKGLAGLTDDELGISGQPTYTQPVQPQVQTGYTQPVSSGNNQQQPQGIDPNLFQQKLAEIQNQNASMLVGALSRQYKFRKEFGDDLDVERVITYANQQGVDLDTAINDVYDVETKRQQRTQADQQKLIDAAVAKAKDEWQQQHATDGLFAPSVPASTLPPAFQMRLNEVPAAGQPPVAQRSQEDRLADQMRRAQSIVAGTA